MKKQRQELQAKMKTLNDVDKQYRQACAQMPFEESHKLLVAQYTESRKRQRKEGIRMSARYQILALWLLVLLGSALIEEPKAYLDPELRMTYIGFGLLTIVCIVTWIGLSKIMKR